MKRRPPAELDAALERYAELIRRYHATLDLMSDAGVASLDAHLEDARVYADTIATISPAPDRLLDVGSGVGLPGVVIAAALPELAVELVERRRKRATFLRMAVAAVGRPDAVVRAGDVRAGDGPDADVITAQAVARLAEVYALTRNRVGASVVLLARKGDDWRDEVEELADTVARAGARPRPHESPTPPAGDGDDGADDAPQNTAETPSATTVLAARPLSRRGTLVAVRVNA